MVKPRENRVPIMMSDEELQSIDDWRFSSRVATRSDAVRRLCQIAILLEPLVNDLKSLWEETQQASTSIHEALIDAHAGGDGRSASDVLKSFERPISDLLPSTMNLGIHTWTMEEVLERLKSGTDIVGSIDDLKRNISQSDRARSAIRELAREPIEIREFTSPQSEEKP